MAESYETRSRPEQLAIWTLRRLRHDGTSPFDAGAGRTSPVGRELEAILRRLRLADALLRTERGTGFCLASPGHLGITAEEHCLVRATSAAQAGDEPRLARELASLLHESRAHSPLAQALTLLGAVLAAQDHWLPLPEDAAPRGTSFALASHQKGHAHAFRIFGQPVRRSSRP